ncbi:hypothetical protein GCM10010417_25480 [Streptomyces carpaticus]
MEFTGGGHELLDGDGVGDIQRAAVGGAAGGGDLGGERSEPVGAAGAEQDPVAIGGEPAGGRLADAAAGSGDRDDAGFGHGGAPCRLEGFPGCLGANRPSARSSLGAARRADQDGRWLGVPHPGRAVCRSVGWGA